VIDPVQAAFPRAAPVRLSTSAPSGATRQPHLAHQIGLASTQVVEFSNRPQCRCAALLRRPPEQTAKVELRDFDLKRDRTSEPLWTNSRR
jgi:hypothetical protein